MKGGAVHRYLDERNIPHALIGGHAVAARGYPRFTLDVDFLTADASVLRSDFWSALDAEMSLDIRKGDFDDPLRGVVRITLADRSSVDLVVAKYKWQAAVIQRAEPIDVDGIVIPVPRTPDLILLKLFAGGVQDLRDVRELVDMPDREQIVQEVREYLSELPPECTSAFDEELRRLP